MILPKQLSKLAVFIIATTLNICGISAMDSLPKNNALAQEVFILFKKPPYSLPLDIVKIIAFDLYIIQKLSDNVKENCKTPRDLLKSIHNLHDRCGIKEAIKVLQMCLKSKNTSLCQIKDFSKKTVLHHASGYWMCEIIEKNCLDCVKIILQAVIDHEKLVELIYAKDQSGYTAAELALFHKDDEILNLLTQAVISPKESIHRKKSLTQYSNILKIKKLINKL